MKPTVLLVGPSLNAVSGVATHLNQILESSLKDLYHFTYYQVGSEDRMENLLQKMTRGIKSPLWIFTLGLSRKIDLIHLNPSLNIKSFFRDSIYLIILKSTGNKVIWQTHGGDLPQIFCKGNSFLCFIVKKIIGLADIIIVINRNIYDAYRQFLPRKRITLVPNAIDLADYQLTNHTFSEYRSYYNLIYIGRVASNKGIRESIIALDLLRREVFFDKLFFHIVGSGPAEKALKRQADDLALSRQIRFWGPVFGGKKIEILRLARLLLFPTYHKEGLPYTIIEALAAGTPPITTDVGGIRDAIDDEIHGVIVKPKCPAEIASAIKRLVENEPLRSKMATNCLKRCEEQFGIVRLVNQLDGIYQSLISH